MVCVRMMDDTLFRIQSIAFDIFKSPSRTWMPQLIGCHERSGASCNDDMIQVDL